MATTTVLSTLSSELAQIVDDAGRYVVGVGAGGRRPASGLAIGGDLVLTADHVVERNAGSTVVTLQGERREAVVAGRDPASDLAVLRVAGLAAAEPARSPLPAPGSIAISVARTSAGTLSTGLGVITSIGGPLRTGRGVALRQIIRTDAALRPGTAGGALVDAGGRIIGMTTPGLLRGLPVAIPAEYAFEIAGRLASNRPPRRGYLGVSIQPVSLAETQRTAAGDSEAGLLVFAVADESAAARAGVLVGDILVRFNDRPLTAPEELQDQLADIEPGTSGELTIVRGTASQQVTITAGARQPG